MQVEFLFGLEITWTHKSDYLFWVNISRQPHLQKEFKFYTKTCPHI